MFYRVVASEGSRPMGQYLDWIRGLFYGVVASGGSRPIGQCLDGNLDRELDGRLNWELED